MTEAQQLIVFTMLSFVALGLGSVVLSVVTLVARGNRSFAVIMGASTTALGFCVYFGVDPAGMWVVALGALALLLAVIPRRKR
jgi:hypothetical protein